MLDSLKEECGVVAVYQMGNDAEPRNVAPLAVRALLAMQNRGQLSAGLTTYNPHRNRILQTHKDLGSVQEVFALNNPHKSRRLMEEYGGIAAIGHNRYATSGNTDPSLAQPFERMHGRMWKWFAIGFNGNLANYDALQAKLEDSGYHITYHTDTEVMMHYINRELRGDEQPDYRQMCANLARNFDGAYNITFLNATGELLCMRDPLGIKPLCYAVQDNMLVVASESVVMSQMGIEDVHTLEPGEVLIADRAGYRVERYWPEQPSAYCYFEWVYFSNLASNLEGRSVYKVRHAIGREMAEMEPLADRDDMLVVAVPETASAIANSFAYHLGLPAMEGLLRNRYVGRTFIDGVTREDTLRMKFTPLREILEGKRIFLVDDTLVRGNTLATVISDLRERGHAKEIHVRIGCPPIMGPCFYGIDMPTVKELFAPAFTGGRAPQDAVSDEVLGKMTHALGADSLSYLSMSRLQRALGIPGNELCMACIDNRYPTPVGNERYREALHDAGFKAADDTGEPHPLRKAVSG